MEEVFFLLASYGVTFLVCDAKVLSFPRNLFRRIRRLDELLDCYFCVGFWVGLGLYLALYGVMEDRESMVQFFVYGFSGAAFAYVINTAVLWLESRHISEDDFSLMDFGCYDDHEDDDPYDH